MAAITVDNGLLTIFTPLEFLALNDNIRLQKRDKFFKRERKRQHRIDHGNRFHALLAHGGRHCDAGCMVRVDSDDEKIADLGGKFQKPHMPGVYDVEISRDESNFSAGAGLAPNTGDRI